LARANAATHRITKSEKEETMKVAIIGAGNVGKALGGSLSRAGHDVTFSASTQESATAAAQEVGAKSAVSTAVAAQGAEVVIVAVPYAAADAVASDLAPHVADTVVIDATNPIKADYSGLATNGTSAAEELQRRLPDAKVIKAFNTVFASNQAGAGAGDERIDGYIAGDDVEAKATATTLVEDIGLRALDVGPLSSARYLEGMAWLNIGLNAANGWTWTSAWHLRR
jgi:predicted dinucleotide-binding enzyme